MKIIVDEHWSKKLYSSGALEKGISKKLKRRVDCEFVGNLTLCMPGPWVGGILGRIRPSKGHKMSTKEAFSILKVTSDSLSSVLSAQDIKFSKMWQWWGGGGDDKWQNWTHIIQKMTYFHCANLKARGPSWRKMARIFVLDTWRGVEVSPIYFLSTSIMVWELWFFKKYPPGGI